jgi:hypothetical protein
MKAIEFFEIATLNKNRLPTSGFEQWDRDGVLELPGLIPNELIDAYIEERKKLIGDTEKWRPGWNGPTPYLHVPSMKALALHRELTKAMRPLVGRSEVGLHLCLTGFQSTERAFHSDSYLNPAFVEDRYIAAWIALDDIHEDSGPFEYFPGSHRLPVLEQEKVWSKMRQLGQDPKLPTWPSDSQEWIGNVCEEECLKRGMETKTFLPKKGDVLLWSAYLIHRGSKAKNPELERRALICHYSSIDRRPDMPHLKKFENGSFYFDFPGSAEPEKTTHKSI